MKSFIKLMAVAGMAGIFALAGCGSGGSSSSDGSGILSLSLTDAPLVDDGSVTGVYITITGIEYHTDEGGWQRMEEFNTSVNPINLLELQEGKSISLGDFRLPAGTYTQMRFLLDAAEEKERPKSNTGCFIEIDDKNETLYVPSGSQTGFKAVGNYVVPEHGIVKITADFNVRKSIVASGNGKFYKLKPTIKLVLTDVAGTINGTVSNLDVNSSYVVYAYKYIDGVSTWDINETDDPDPSDAADIRFPNAVASSPVGADGSYTLAYLVPGDYDLALAKYDVNGDYETYYLEGNITVGDGQTVLVDWVL